MKVIRPTKLGVFPKLDDGVHSVALGNCTQWRFSINSTQHGKFIAVEVHGAYEFQSYAHWDYVREKLGIGEGDARNVADFINSQTQDKFITQGSYDESLCSEIAKPAKMVILA